METMNYGNEGKTTIYMDAPLELLTELLGTRSVVLIVDAGIYPLLKALLPKTLVYTVASGEHSKSMRQAAEIYRFLQNNGVDRDTVLVGIGGGVVTDLTGFVAATYLRGVSLILVPTTVLAQVDAAIGGKNAVNLHGFKNIIGTIYQPEAIVCDYNLLTTLPDEEIRGGVAEMIKHCMIADRDQFDYFSEHVDDILLLQREALQTIIPWSIRIKTEFIETDVFDRSVRRLLNFGHTWGHAVEAVTGLHHGYAVSVGMCFATRLAVHKGLCDSSVLNALETLLERFGLPTTTNALPWVVFEAMKRDKKRSAGNIHFILPREIGKTEIVDLSLEELKSFIKEA